MAQQELGRLIKIPGIGKKTAERLLLELKGKLAESSGITINSPVDGLSSSPGLANSTRTGTVRVWAFKVG